VGEHSLTELVEGGLKRIGIIISKPILAILCVTFGILAMVWEPLLRYIFGIFLIIAGMLLFIDYLELKTRQPPPPPPPT